MINYYKTPSPKPTSASVNTSTRMKKNNQVKATLYLRDGSAGLLDVAK